jgi:hypothetical protein
MKTLLLHFFSHNWQRKSVALLLGIVIWLMVNHSLTATKVIPNVPVRIINLPPGKTIEGMQSSGTLSKKLSLTLIGNADTLNNLNASDIEIVIDATGKSDGWGAPISKKNLVSLNPEIDITKRISKVYHHTLVLRMTNLVTETIPIIVTHPIGEAPRGYQFLDVWPYKLALTVSGPEEVIKRLKAKEQKITFNLNDISKGQLDALAAKQSPDSPPDVISFFVPDQWKQINIPLLSDVPFELDETTENRLRIDFIRCNLIPLDTPVLVSLFYPPEYDSIYNPTTLTLTPSQLLSENHGIFSIKPLLYAQGSDRLFAQVIKNRIQITLIVSPPSQRQFLEWSILFINPTQLEDQYVSTLMTDVSDEDIRLMTPTMRENYLRNRFRSYMNRFSLFTQNDTPFDLGARIVGNTVTVEELKTPPSLSN